MTQIKAHIPKIRFKEFSWEWENWKIEDNFQVRMCKIIFNHETSNDWEIPFYKIWTIWKQADSFISKELFDEYKTKYNYPKKWELMLTCSWTVWRTIIFDWKDSYFQDSNIVWLDNQKSEINNNFLYYIISNYDWWKLNATTITRIYNDDLRKLKISFPSLPEQQKIASFLSSVDEKIEKIKEKKKNLEEYKKWVMQKIFSQEIRFKDENWEEFGEWEEKKLAEICEKQSSNISANTLETNTWNYKIYWATWFLKFIDFYQEEDDYISIVKDWAWVWRVLYCEWKSSVLGTLDKIKPKKWTNLNFLLSVLSNIDFTKYTIWSTIPHIYFKDYWKEKVNLPTLKEQEKIADFLSGIDEKIEKVSDELEKMKEFKKGLLQGMFV